MNGAVKKYKVVAGNRINKTKYVIRRHRFGCRFGCENGLIKLENEESVECPDCYHYKYRQTNRNRYEQTDIDRGLNHYRDIFPQRNKSKAFNEHYPYKHPKKETNNYINTFLWIAAIFLAFCIFARAGG